MLPYQFNEIYYKTTGEYENGIRVIFIAHAQTEMLVYELGCFYLVNQPANINLKTYKQSTFDTQPYRLNNPQSYNIQQIFEHTANSSIYVKLEDAIMKIAFHFSTAEGQMIEGFGVSDKRNEPEKYKQWLQEIEEARAVDIIDFRFTLD